MWRHVLQEELDARPCLTGAQSNGKDDEQTNPGSPNRVTFSLQPTQETVSAIHRLEGVYDAQEEGV